MNRLAALLTVDDVLVDVEAASEKRLFERAGLVFQTHHAMSMATVTDNLSAPGRR